MVFNLPVDCNLIWRIDQNDVKCRFLCVMQNCITLAFTGSGDTSLLQCYLPQSTCFSHQSQQITANAYPPNIHTSSYIKLVHLRCCSFTRELPSLILGARFGRFWSVFFLLQENKKLKTQLSVADVLIADLKSDVEVLTASRIELMKRVDAVEEENRHFQVRWKDCLIKNKF